MTEQPQSATPSPSTVWTVDTVYNLERIRAHGGRNAPVFLCIQPQNSPPSRRFLCHESGPHKVSGRGAGAFLLGGDLSDHGAAKTTLTGALR